jgi:peptidoglycan endopeptidase LytE
MSRAARVILSTTCALAVLVPSFGGVATAAPPPAPTTTTANTTITVRAGDSLVGLARRYQITLSALLQANSLQLNSIIHPGDTLVIPAGATLPTTGGSTRTLTATSSTPSASTSASSSNSDYVVVAGDALSTIARRHGVSLGALTRANGISATALIVPGQRLHVPPATRPIPPAALPSAVTRSSQPASTVSPPAVQAATSNSMQTMLNYATAQVGLPYRFFSAGPDAFDCSGLVVAAFRQVGVSVPHQSRSLARMGSPVDWKVDPIAAGDLVFTSSMDNPELITHVGIALDSKRWVNAVGLGRSVSISSLPSDSKIMAVQRIALP